MTAGLSLLESGCTIFSTSKFRARREDRLERDDGFVFRCAAFEPLFRIGFPAENIFHKYFLNLLS